MRVETTGEVVVSTGLTTQGQGHFTTLAQIAADALGTPLESVTVITGDTRRFKYAVGTFASRAIVTSGNAVAVAAGKVADKAKRIAAPALGVAESELEIVDGFVRVGADPAKSIALKTVAVLSNPLRYAFDKAAQAATQFAVGDTSKPPVAEDDEPGLEGRDYYSPMGSTFANGMHAVVVETDPTRARRVLNDRLLGSWMGTGVTILDPASTWVDVGVVLEPGAQIGPATQLQGDTTVGAGARVGPGLSAPRSGLDADRRSERVHVLRAGPPHPARPVWRAVRRIRARV